MVYAVTIKPKGEDPEVVLASIPEHQAVRLRGILEEAVDSMDIEGFYIIPLKSDDKILSLAGLQGWMNRHGLPAPV